MKEIEEATELEQDKFKAKFKIYKQTQTFLQACILLTTAVLHIPFACMYNANFLFLYNPLLQIQYLLRMRSGYWVCPHLGVVKVFLTNSLGQICVLFALKMPKHEAMTPKAIANKIKSKGLQKLRWYCQMCQKQCRDEVCII